MLQLTQWIVFPFTPPSTDMTVLLHKSKYISNDLQVIGEIPISREIHADFLWVSSFSGDLTNNLQRDRTGRRGRTAGMDGEAIFFTGRCGEGQGQKPMGRGGAGNPFLTVKST